MVRSSEVISNIERKRILELLSQGKRLDGRGLKDYREIKVERGVVDRGIRGSKAIDLEKLCLVPGKKVLVVFVDVYVLNHCGNLFDASELASVLALMEAKVAKYVVGKGGEVKTKAKRVPLPVRNYPVSVTMARIGGEFVVDPSLDEEMVADARITVTTDKDENVCAVQKGGVGVFSIDEVMEAVDIAVEKSGELRRKVLGV